MATLHGKPASRKKITTYGKAAPRRISDYGFNSIARKSKTPDRETEIPRHRVTSAAPETLMPSRPTTPSKVRPVRPRSRSRTPSAKALDIFDVPNTDDDLELPAPKARKPGGTAPRSKPAPYRSMSQSPARKPPVNIFDAPESEDDAPAPTHSRKSAPRPPPPPPAKLKSILRRSPPKASSSPTKDLDEISPDDEPCKPTEKAAKKIISKQQQESSVRQRSVPALSPVITTRRDIFDFPSDDEMTATPIFKVTKRISPANEKGQVNHKPPASEAEANLTRKKPKVSPAGPSLKELPPKNPRPHLKPRAMKPRGRNTSPQTGQTAKMVARPKVQESLEQTDEAIQTSRKLGMSPEPAMPSVSVSDVQMADADPSERHVSPQSRKMWEALLGSDGSGGGSAGSRGDVLEVDKRRVSTKVGNPEPRVRTRLFRSAGVSKPARKISPKLPRRRLIDSLVEQAVSSDGDESRDETSSPDYSTEPDTVMEDVPISQNVLASASESQNPQTAGPKFTYAKQRSMLNEEDLMTSLSMELPTVSIQNDSRRGRRASIPSMKQLSSFREDVDDEDESVAAIRSVHELRHAGANNRFLDDVQDMLERIGCPERSGTSMRRSGLLDLACKMQDKTFSRQFRSNGIEQKLFVHLGQETEIVTGFLMVSILISLLNEGTMPHIVAHLRLQGITRLLIRLLACQSGIVAVAKDRKSNMSKVAISLLSEHQDFLINLPGPGWEEHTKPQVLSPRTVALKCLELMVRQTREAGQTGDIFSKELTTHLFAIVKCASNESSWALPADKAAIDFYLALSALESHSLAARTTKDETIWINEFLPIIADTLHTALIRPVGEFGILQSLLIRLTLHTTNNNPRASDVFARVSLMSTMGQVLVSRFEQIARFILEEDLLVAVDQLVLVLGAMINFAECSPSCQQSLQSLKGHPADPLDKLVQAFADSIESTSQADSFVATHKNVAFAYLSVLLGYLSLNASLSARIQAQLPRKSLRPVLASIEEFIRMHKSVDMMAADEDDHNPQTVLTERLEGLVGRMKEVNGR
ncbi:hypothetical protein B2J93_6492 [Marssonina coronariae]|uniref:Wings apart-like protein C-terminal domain-containing protein n=1 Tax=Diplocarpon coronariae TaxID=2795749 RepID=A0A218Z3M3_9HELO|nr:hypothetical protein B2J93_6492 [Marssonina coronariae]